VTIKSRLNGFSLTSRLSCRDAPHDSEAEKLAIAKKVTRSRVSTVAVYGLAALASQGIAHPALTQSLQDPVPESDEAEDIALPVRADELAGEAINKKQVTRAIAAPETLSTREFTREVAPALELSQAPSSQIAAPESFALETSSAAQLPSPPAAQAESVASQKPEANRTTARELAARQNTRAQDLQPMSEKAHLQAQEMESECKDEAEARLPENAIASATPMVVAQRQSGTSCSEVEGLREELRTLEDVEIDGGFRASPALSIMIPTAFGADNNTGFITGTYQERTRYSGGVDDGAIGVGIGLGNAQNAVGVELSYALASFGTSRDFGSGGFNVKVHRRLPGDFAIAAGWNGFLNLGDDNDFEDSLYGVVSKVIRTREDIDKPFSRIALTAGVGNGMFRSEDAVADDDDTIGVFGNVAVRVARPVSFIAEWSGQDLGLGLSVAPFENIPLVITPAVRDITGAGDGARFVLGTGLAFKF
jgi:hypothetical protein